MIRRLASNARGTALTEFAMVLPAMLVLFFGGYQLSDAMACKRRVTIMTRAVGDLTSQYRTLGTSVLDTFLGASTQIMAPYEADAADIRVSQVTIEATGLRYRIDWSRRRVGGVAGNGTTPGSYPIADIPVAFRQPGMTFIYTEATYRYTSVLPAFFGSTSFSQTIWLLPRRSSTITLT